MLIYKVRRIIAALFIDFSMAYMLAVLLSYVVISYFLMSLCGETQIIASDTFIYWLVVTASTVGYGDISPTTLEGKYVTAFFVIPSGLSLFALTVTKVGMFISDTIQKGKKGQRMHKLTHHCVIIGWNGVRTIRLIDLLLAKENKHDERIVLCVVEEMENPLPEKIDFVKAETFTHHDTMLRANLSAANRIIIDTPSDNVTLTTALYCNRQSPDSHKTVYFQDESVGDLLRPHCPNIEIVPSVSVELLARSSIDPGSADFHHKLLDPLSGASQYSMLYQSNDTKSFGELLTYWRENYDATLMGLRVTKHDEILLNPPMNTPISEGYTLFYLADKRLDKNAIFS